jgi:hypothetical protein
MPPQSDIGETDFVVNLEESIGKQVGRRRAPDPLRIQPGEKEAARAWTRLSGGSGIRKGLYRFETHEQADTWLWKMLSRRKKS